MSQWFSEAGFMPHGHCYLWTSSLLWTYVLSDGVITLSYYSIPIALAYFVFKRKDIPFTGIWLLFATFIFACGTTHILSVWTIWHPDYWVDALIRAFTAIVSLITAVILWPLIPKALRIPSVVMLQETIARLENEISERKKAEAALEDLNNSLERRVRERTAELSALNEKLHTEIALTRKAEQKLFTVIENSPCAIFTVDSKGIIELVNVQTEAIFGYQRAELVGQAIEVLVPDTLKKAHGHFRSEYLENPSARFMGANRELKGCRKDGSLVDIEVALAPIETVTGVGAMAIVLDISERVRVSNKLARHVSELARSNEELDHFAHIASHDLKAPLRGIDQLATWITEDLGDQLDPTTQKRLQQMRNRINRMGRLLDDLLVYARVGHVNDISVETDTGVMIRDVFAFINAPSGFELSIEEPMPIFVTARVPLEQIFRNLISNAVKHHDRMEGQVKVGVKEHDNHYEFSITDDGPGIPIQYHQHVFGMFQTLKSKDKVEGSGMGLALAKKIAETYGGAISLASEGRGTTVFFNWPRNMDNHSASG